MKRTLVSGLGLALVAIVLASAAVVTSRTPDPRKEVRVSAATAVDAVRRFKNDPQMKATGPFEGRRNRFYAVEGAAVSATVDAFDATVLTLTLSDQFPGGSRVSVSAAVAAAAASRFLDVYRVSTADLAQKVTLVDHGDTREFRVEWDKRVNGALVPVYRSVSINPDTGLAFGLLNFSRPYTDPAPPTVGREAAESTARTLTGEGVWEPVSTDLQVTFDDQGAQLLVWMFEYSDAVAGAAVRVQVDAYSGAGVVVARG
jgi:hypothetical protein